MAQIKNIKKPGDLIRGASVGLAGLDKDGNVVGYKAAAADAGKVLTVGEDGSVAPAEGGSNATYIHQVKIMSNGARIGTCYLILPNDTLISTRGAFYTALATQGSSDMDKVAFFPSNDDYAWTFMSHTYVPYGLSKNGALFGISVFSDAIHFAQSSFPENVTFMDDILP